LKRELEKGLYKIPFSNYVESNYTGFRNINLKSASTVNIKIEKGPFHVLIEPSVRNYAHLKMNGDTLEIETVFPDEYHGYSVDFAMYISCPEISSIHSDALYRIMSKEFVERDAERSRRTTIEGFSLDSLNIIATNGSDIRLVSDTIRNLNAVIGIDSASASKFYIGKNNHFDHANINVRNLSRFWIGYADTTQAFNYTLSDSAQLIVSGRANHVIKKLQ